MTLTPTAIIDRYKIKSKVNVIDKSEGYYLQGFVYQHPKLKDGKFITAFIKDVVKTSDGDVLYKTNFGILRGGDIVGPDDDENLATTMGYYGMICGTSTTLPLDSRHGKCFGLIHKGIAVNCGSGIANFAANLTTKDVNLFLPCSDVMVKDYAYAPEFVNVCVSHDINCTIWVPLGSVFNVLPPKVVKRAKEVRIDDITVWYGLGYLIMETNSGGVLAYVNVAANRSEFLKVLGGRRVDTLLVEAGTLPLETLLMIGAEQVLVSDYANYKLADRYTDRIAAADIPATTAVEGLLFFSG